MDYTYIRTGAAQDWQCPICQRVLSPWTQECPCKGQPESTITSTSDKEVYDKIESLIWAISFEITRNDLDTNTKIILKKIKSYLEDLTVTD